MTILCSILLYPTVLYCVLSSCILIPLPLPTQLSPSRCSAGAEFWLTHHTGSLHCILHTANCTLYTANCTLHTSQYKLHNTNCKLHIAQPMDTGPSHCTILNTSGLVWSGRQMFRPHPRESLHSLTEILLKSETSLRASLHIFPYLLSTFFGHIWGTVC